MRKIKLSSEKDLFKVKEILSEAFKKNIRFILQDPISNTKKGFLNETEYDSEKYLLLNVYSKIDEPLDSLRNNLSGELSNLTADEITIITKMMPFDSFGCIQLELNDDHLGIVPHVCDGNVCPGIVRAIIARDVMFIKEEKDMLDMDNKPWLESKESWDYIYPVNSSVDDLLKKYPNKIEKKESRKFISFAKGTETIFVPFADE